MAKFSYKVRDAQGRLVDGTMDANTVDECMNRLEEKNLIPVAIEELNFDGSMKNRSFFDKINQWIVKKQHRVQYRDVVFFTRQLATMINGGVSLPKAIDQLSKNEKPVFRRILEQVCDDIGMGLTFSDAIARHPGAFDNMFVAVIRAGEAAGALDRVLLQLADYMENMEALKAKVKAALRYPTVIAALVFAMVTGILVFLVPVFQNMYASFGAKLPAATQLLIDTSNMIKNNMPVVILILLIFIALIATLLNIDSTLYLWHKYLLRMPVFGSILRKNILAVYSRTMSLLLESGTPILEATQISGAVVNNKHYAKALEDVYNDLRQGELLSAALGKHPQEFPVLVTQLVQTGEESGRIDDLLVKAAQFYEREVRNTVESLSSIIEPILIVILGSLVGAILIALYLPVFQMGKLLKS